MPLYDYNVFISTKPVINVPFQCDLVICPIGRIIAPNPITGHVTRGKGVGFLDPSCSPLGWYQSLFKSNILRKDNLNFVFFDNEVKLPDFKFPDDDDDTGVLKVTNRRVHEFKRKYPMPLDFGISKFKLYRSEVPLFSKLIDCTDDELYIARYVQNATWRIYAKNRLRYPF